MLTARRPDDRMLEDPELQDAIEWKSDSSFVVPDPEYFARSVRLSSLLIAGREGADKCSDGLYDAQGGMSTAVQALELAVVRSTAQHVRLLKGLVRVADSTIDIGPAFTAEPTGRRPAWMGMYVLSRFHIGFPLS